MMNQVKELTCVVCPVGCPLTVTLDGDGKILAVTGNTCPRGKAYAETELTAPTRTLTSTVTLQSEAECRLPVRTDRPIPKGEMARAMEQIMQITVTAPIRRGDVIVPDFMEPGTNLIACKSIDK